MPDPDARRPRAVRLSPAGIDAVSAVAERDGISWSEALRRLLAWAMRPERPMPPGWHPNHSKRGDA